MVRRLASQLELVHDLINSGLPEAADSFSLLKVKFTLYNKRTELNQRVVNITSVARCFEGSEKLTMHLRMTNG